MVDEVLIEVRPGRVRTAMLGAGRLLEFIVEDDHKPSVVGNIYLGRVEKIVASLNAAFIDLGLQRSGFLALAEARPAGLKATPNETISTYLCEGDMLNVQVLRDPFEDKGPKLTARLALSAGTVVLTTADRAIRISKRIDDAPRRARLETLVQGLAGPDEGFVVRTAAQGASEQVISADIARLREAWADLQATAQTASPPALLRAAPDRLMTALMGDVRVVVDDTAAYLRARSLLEKTAPDQLERLVLDQGVEPLLGREGLADDLEQALASEVILPSGGTLIFSETPALVAIDVNVAGAVGVGRGQAALKTNLEAAVEIARHIRLRNLSGLLVVDFVSSKGRDHAAKLLDALRTAVADDPQQVFVGGFTRFGLLEMTRQRSRPSLASSIGAPCQLCGGSGHRPSPQSVAYAALDRLAREAGWEPSQGLKLICGQNIADTLAGPLKPALDALEQRLGRQVNITLDDQLADGDYDIVQTIINKGI